MGRARVWIGAAVIAAMLPAAADARQVSAWTEIEQLRADLKADRQAVVAVNLPLSEAESKRSGRSTRTTAARSTSSAIAPPS